MKNFRSALMNKRRLFSFFSILAGCLLCITANAAVGPIVSSPQQVNGSLAGRIVFASGGHGWILDGSWTLQRVALLDMNEDLSNMDQATMFAHYCFNAGATVVAFRGVGHQTNAVILDNTSPAVTWGGDWQDNTTEPVYFGNVGETRFRWAAVSQTETATATYTPTIPVAGLYPVYCWTPHGGATPSVPRTNQLYRINHTGGQALVRIPHHMIGAGWVYLGTYYFNQGSNAPTGAVIISNEQPSPDTNTAVVADAIRFGNGMSRSGSGYACEEDGGYYWVKESLGQGQPATIYDNATNSIPDDDRGSRPRQAREMNREQSGNMYKRVFVSFHSNAATSSGTNTARGALGVYNHSSRPTTVTLNQYQLTLMLAKEVTDDLISLNSQIEFPWYDRGSGNTYATSSREYYEISNLNISGEFDAALLEVAFHDNVPDAALMRDPKVRNWVARASYQAVVRYFNKYDALPLVFLPEPPFNARATSATNGIQIAWNPPAAQAGSGAASGYIIYCSTNGFGFGNPIMISGGGTTSFVLTNLADDVDYYFRISATNSAGESFPSEVVGCRRSTAPTLSRVLYVNAFTRFDKTLNPRQQLTPLNWTPIGNSGVIDRIIPRMANSFDYVVQHGKAISAYGLPFDSCLRDAVANNQIALTNYDIVIWGAGLELTNIFNSTVQSRIASFMAGGGSFLLSGADVAWNLARSAGPSASDRAFMSNQLHAVLASDSNTNSQSWAFASVSGAVFNGSDNGEIDNGTKGIAWVKGPDVLTPSGPGAQAALTYVGGLGGSAAVQYDGSAGGGRVIFLGFPFETITSGGLRAELMAKMLKYLTPPKFLGAAPLPDQPALRLTLRGALREEYVLEHSPDLGSWTAIATNSVDAAGRLEFEPVRVSENAFYRAKLKQ